MPAPMQFYAATARGSVERSGSMLAVALKFYFLLVIRVGAVITAVFFVIPDHALTFRVRAFVLALCIHYAIS